MQLTKMDLLFILVLVLMLARALRSLLAGQKVELVLHQPGKRIADLLLLVLFAGVVLLRRATLSSPLLLIGGAMASVALSAFAKAGLCSEGLIQNGKTVPYKSMRSFRIERETEKEILFRIAASGRDYGVSILPAQKEEFLTRMAAVGVKSADDAPDFDPYTGEDT